jgi:hypothetical protein
MSSRSRNHEVLHVAIRLGGADRVDEHQLALVTVRIREGLVEVRGAELEYAGRSIQEPFVFRRVVIECGTKLVEVETVKSEHRYLLHPPDWMGAA